MFCYCFDRFFPFVRLFVRFIDTKNMIREQINNNIQNNFFSVFGAIKKNGYWLKCISKQQGMKKMKFNCNHQYNQMNNPLPKKKTTNKNNGKKNDHHHHHTYITTSMIQKLYNTIVPNHFKIAIEYGI